MRELNLDQIRTLISVVDLGSFSLAARALHLAQPTVSLHVSELEERLNTQLLLRGGRRIVPTSAGDELVARGRQLLRDADEAIEAVVRRAQGNIGKVRVGASTGILAHLLPQVLRTMELFYPGIDVQVKVLGSAEIIRDLDERKIDLGMVAIPQVHGRDIVLTPWRAIPMMAYVPEKWSTPLSVTADWLADKPLIFNDPSTQMYQLTMDWFAQSGHVPRAKIEHNHSEAMQSLVVAGYGAAVLPLEHEIDGVPRPGLKILPLDPSVTRHIAIGHRALEQLDGTVIKFLDVLKSATS